MGAKKDRKKGKTFFKTVKRLENRLALVEAKERFWQQLNNRWWKGKLVVIPYVPLKARMAEEGALVFDFEEV